MKVNFLFRYLFALFDILFETRLDVVLVIGVAALVQFRYLREKSLTLPIDEMQQRETDFAYQIDFFD